MKIEQITFNHEDLNKGIVKLELTVAEMTEIVSLVRTHLGLSIGLLGDFDQVDDEMNQTVLEEARKRVSFE